MGRFAYLLFVVVMLSLAACSTKVTKPATHGTETVVLDKSPVSGKELHQAERRQLELNAELLAKCPIPLPPPPKKGSSVTVSAVKKAETAIYYQCAYLHNALVDFLNLRLGIKPDPDDAADLAQPSKK